jgi:hypothetical protein
MFTYEVMFNFWDDMTVSPLTYTAHHERMRMAHVRSQTEALLPTRAVIRRALQRLLSLMDVDYKNDFSCPCCSLLPPEEMIIVMDGTSLGFPKDFAFTGINPPADLADPYPDM